MESDTMIKLANVSTESILSSPVDTLSLADKVSAHVVLAALCEASKARLEALKGDLTIYTMAKGQEEGDKGTVALTVENSKVSIESRRPTSPECDGLLELLHAKGLTADDATDVVKTLKVNPSKVAYLVSIGKITQDEVDSLRPAVPALRIYPSKALKAAIEPLKALAGKAEK